MKKKIVLMLFALSMLACLLALSVSAEVTVYDDAPAKTKIEVSTNDVVVFDDGFTCPTGYIFKDQNEVYNGGHKNPTLDDACDFTYINEKTNKNYTFSSVVEIDLPQGLTFIGNYAAMGLNNLRRVTIPDSVTSLGGCIFQESKGLEECVFEHNENSKLKTFPNFMFYATPLKAFSMPDCITTVEGAAQFSNCVSLTALYISKNITTWKSGSQSSASFFKCTSMYFTNEAFTYDNIPEKADVYYFPANLETITGETFKTCTNLNSYLVFGTKLVDIDDTGTMPWAFNGCGNTPTLVFLGDMQGIAIGRNGGEDYWNVKNIVFANPNDKSTSDIGFIGKSSSKLVFCNAEGNTTHFAEKTVSEPAKCEVDAGVVTYCFCGYEISKVAEEGTALKHDYDYVNGKGTLIAYNYTDISKAGTKTVKCGICAVDNPSIEALPLIVYNGYSVDGKGAVCVGYAINYDEIKRYEALTDEDLVYGFVASANNNTPLDQSGEAVNANVIKTVLSNDRYTAVDFILTAKNWNDEAASSAKLSLNMYVISGGAVKYITENGLSDVAEQKTYAEI